MKSIVLICVIGMACVASEEHYTDKYDNVDVKEVLENDRLFTGYFKCLMDRGPCVADAKELRDRVVEALETDCAKCTTEQKEKSEFVLKTMHKTRPGAFKELSEKYDPKGTFLKKYGYKLQE